MADQEEVKATLFGAPIAVKGINMLVVVVLAAALGGLIYLLLGQMRDQEAAQGQQTQHQTIEHEALVDSLRSIGELIDEQNFIVLSNEAERTAMKEKLRRPSSLSKKLKAQSE